MWVASANNTLSLYSTDGQGRKRYLLSDLGSASFVPDTMTPLVATLDPQKAPRPVAVASE